MFKLESSFNAAGDQPKAIEKILAGYNQGYNKQTLLGATGTGKTFTMANVIQEVQKPTLLISHNKTLAAQLATELKHFFPNNAVHYFVSYFDYYQPESYLPTKDTYIEKEATINQEIEMYRLATMASLLTRDDVIVVASASSLYGLGQKRFFQENLLDLKVGEEYDYQAIKRQLLKIQYQPVLGKIEHGMFDMRGEIVDIFSSTEKYLYRLYFNEEKLEHIEMRDSTTFEVKGTKAHVSIWPATQFLQDTENMEVILKQMEAEMNLRVKEFEDQKMLVEAQRIKKRVSYDIRMIKETGFVNGIENYSLYFDNRLPGEPPNTIFDYFPEDFLLIIDESHMTLPQLRAMPQADRSRKTNLIKYGFRLPSAIDHRPVRFEELETTVGRKNIKNFDADQAGEGLENISNAHVKVLEKSNNKIKEARKENNIISLKKKQKHNAKTLFLSATPADYELGISDQVVQQIIRPTGLLDPITYVYPKSGNYNELLTSVDTLLKKKPYMKEFMDGYDLEYGIQEVFHN